MLGACVKVNMYSTSQQTAVGTTVGGSWTTPLTTSAVRRGTVGQTCPLGVGREGIATSTMETTLMRTTLSTCRSRCVCVRVCVYVCVCIHVCGWVCKYVLCRCKCVIMMSSFLVVQ